MNIDNIVENEEYTQEELRELLNVGDYFLLNLISDTSVQAKGLDNQYDLKHKENKFGETKGVHPNLKIKITSKVIFKQASERV